MFTLFLIIIFIVAAVTWPAVTRGINSASLARHKDEIAQAEEAGKTVRRTPKKVTSKWALIPLGLAVLTLALSCTTIIHAKNAGVLVTFGKPSERTLSNGIHAKLPWQDVVEVDGTVQTDEHKADLAIPVRIGDGSQSNVSLTIRWRISPEHVNEIYANYRSDDPTQSLRSAVVSTQLEFAAQEVLAAYNPISQLQVVEGGTTTAADLNFSPDYVQLGTDIKAAFEERPNAGLVIVDDITVSYVSLSPSTQTTIDTFIQEVGKTRTAAQARNTASELAAANRELRASLPDGDGVVAIRCLDTMEKFLEAGAPLPAGFNCLGNGGGVVIPSAPVETPQP